MRTSFEEILAWYGYMDLLQSWWPHQRMKSAPYGGAHLWKGRRGHHCSAFVAVGSFTKSGQIVMAHNSWDRYAAGDAFNIIFDIWPESGHKILMQGMAGCKSSLTDFWLTSAGLMITETTISRFHGYEESGAPEFFRSRRASQYADNIDEWCELFSEKNNGGYANSWLLGDINKNEIALFELGLKSRAIRRTNDGYFLALISQKICVSETRNASAKTRNTQTYEKMAHGDCVGCS